MKQTIKQEKANVALGLVIVLVSTATGNGIVTITGLLVAMLLIIPALKGAWDFTEKPKFDEYGDRIHYDEYGDRIE